VACLLLQGTQRACSLFQFGGNKELPSTTQSSDTILFSGQQAGSVCFNSARPILQMQTRLRGADSPARRWKEHGARLYMKKG
jgi:hypothetical protein